jgi:TetR/AcrR family transcriptional regulator, cholesterol catabolism regulator
MSTPTQTRPDPAAGSRHSDATRERILRAAAEVLANQGYARSHLGEIAAAAGLKAPAIYHYFPSREALIAAVLREGQVRVRAHVVKAVQDLPPRATARTKVEAVVAAHLNVQLELSYFALAVVRTLAHVPPEVRALVQPEVESYHDVWRGLLNEAVADGELRPGVDPSMARMFAVGSLNWAAEWRDDTIPVAQIVENATQMIVRALFD